MLDEKQIFYAKNFLTFFWKFEMVQRLLAAVIDDFREKKNNIMNELKAKVVFEKLYCACNLTDVAGLEFNFKKVKKIKRGEIL